MTAGSSAARHLESAPDVSRVELCFGEACVYKDVVHLLHVDVVAPEGAVLVFYLHGYDGAAISNL